MPDCARATDAKVMAATATHIHAPFDRVPVIAAALSHIVPQQGSGRLNALLKPDSSRQDQPNDWLASASGEFDAEGSFLVAFHRNAHGVPGLSVFESAARGIQFSRAD